MYFHDFSVLVLDTAGAFYEISTHQAHFVAGEHTEIFLGRLFHEVLSLNIQFFAEGNLRLPRASFSGLLTTGSISVCPSG